MKDSSRGTDETGSRVSIFAPRSATGPPVGEARADALNAEQALAAMARIQVRLQRARLVSRCSQSDHRRKATHRSEVTVPSSRAHYLKLEQTVLHQVHRK